MRRAVLIPMAVMLMVAATAAADAADPASVDILGLRLGMAEPQVAAVLLHQGVAPGRMTRQTGPCDNNRTCATITARTRDGELAIRLAPDAGDPEASRAATMLPAATRPETALGDPALKVARISYTLRGTGPGEPTMIRASILERFGPPDQSSPMAWCQPVGMDGRCEADQPSLAFLPDTLTLVLRAAVRDGAGH